MFLIAVIHSACRCIISKMTKERLFLVFNCSVVGIRASTTRYSNFKSTDEKLIATLYACETNHVSFIYLFIQRPIKWQWRETDIKREREPHVWHWQRNKIKLHNVCHIAKVGARIRPAICVILSASVYFLFSLSVCFGFSFVSKGQNIVMAMYERYKVNERKA